MTWIRIGSDLFGERAASGDDSLPELACVDDGDSFSIGVTQAGEVVGWGAAFYGEFGEQPSDAERDKLNEERLLSSPTTIQVQRTCVSVACGLHHVLALSSHGEVIAWGRNTRGETAQPASAKSTCPAIVNFPVSESMRFIALAAGGSHSLALQSTGDVWSWGGNSNGQLGIGNASEYESTPHRIAFSGHVSVHSIAAGYAHSAVLASDGNLFTFGWGLYHQLGHGTTNNSPSPVRVDALDGIEGGMRGVACGTWHTAAISSQGDVYTWGWGPDGQLGPSQGTSAVMPCVVDTEDGYFEREGEDHHAVHVACGARFTLVVSRAGDLFSWGRGAPVLGTATSSHYHTRVTRIAAGHSHAFVCFDGKKSAGS